MDSLFSLRGVSVISAESQAKEGRARDGSLT